MVSTTACHGFLLLQHTTALFSLSDLYILGREWRVIVDQVQINYHGGPMMLAYNQSGVNELLIMRDPHYGRMCFKPLELYILSCGKGLRLRPPPIPQLRM